MTKAEVTLPAAISSVPTARHFVESILAAWGLQELAWTSTLVVSELAANAALHAHGDAFSIRVQAEDGAVRLEVDDSSLRLPQQRTYSVEATTGRGLRLVAELSSEWGVIPSQSGKTVWALVRESDLVDTGDDGLDVDALLDAFGDGDADVIPISEARGRPASDVAPAA
jgi:anti-sigma regulatory factor (Ser/Thr protein kinase)